VYARRSQVLLCEPRVLGLITLATTVFDIVFIEGKKTMSRKVSKSRHRFLAHALARHNLSKTELREADLPQYSAAERHLFYSGELDANLTNIETRKNKWM
jgi:hypothetical protein